MNSSPALTVEGKVDEQVKPKLIKDTINLIGDNFTKTTEKVKTGKPRPFFKNRVIKKPATNENNINNGTESYNIVSPEAEQRQIKRKADSVSFRQSMMNNLQKEKEMLQKAKAIQCPK